PPARVTGTRGVDDYALVLNAGSSTLKFCVYRRPSGGAWTRDAKDQIEGVGRAALDSLAAWLRARYGGVRVRGVGHRVGPGGARFERPTRVTPQVLEELRRLVPLAPLHQPHNLAAIEAVAELLPDVPQVACFDTSFHRGQPAVAQLVPLR